MSNSKKVILRLASTTMLAVLVIFVLISSGCGEKTSTTIPVTTTPFTSPPTTAVAPTVLSISLANLVENVEKGLQEIKTYQMEMLFTMHLKGEIDGEQGNVTLSLIGSGAIDLTNQKARIEMNTRINGEGSGQAVDESISATTYIIDNTAYVGIADPTGQLIWSHYSAPDSTWDQQIQIDGQMNLLKASTIKSLESETLNGVPCYVIELDPDITALWENMLQQTGTASLPLTLTDSQDAIKSISVKYWFDKANLYIQKTYIILSLDFGAEMLSQSDPGALTLDMEATLNFDKYNQPADIQLPDEAAASDSGQTTTASPSTATSQILN